MTVPGLKTYHTALLQAKAYRALRYYIAAYLKSYKLTTMEWTLLGHISDGSSGGIKSTDLAESFGVEMSLMTNTINQLGKQGLVRRKSDQKDKRVRNIKITKKGSALVEEIEKKLSVSLEDWMKGVNPEAFSHYAEVLRFLASKVK